MSTNDYLPTAIPTARQLEFQDWEFGLFLHFGIRTFYEGHRDWDGQPMTPAAFNPTALDCQQWVRTAQQAGMRYIVLTAKHHDGFANWPSQYTNFSVASSTWRDGKGDVVREFTDACRRYDLKVGLYYSPADVAAPEYSNPRAYDEYFIAQVSELMTGYGTIDMLWFDGCGSQGHEYDWPRIIAEIRKAQPDILIFNMGDPDYRWVGNESGIAPLPCWNTVEAVPVAVDTTLHGSTPAQWLPAECDCRMREHNWFYSDHDEHTVKSLQELMGLYYLSVGRGCNLLLNIGPDRRGLLPDKDAARLLEFGREIKRRFGSPLATLSNCTSTENGWECVLPEPQLIDHAVLQEDLSDSEHVRRFALEANVEGHFVRLYEGRNIGHKAICRFPTVRAAQVRLVIIEADAPPRLRTFSLHAGHGGEV